MLWSGCNGSAVAILQILRHMMVGNVIDVSVLALKGRVRSCMFSTVRGVGPCVTRSRLTCLTIFSSRFLAIVFL